MGASLVLTGTSTSTGQSIKKHNITKSPDRCSSGLFYWYNMNFDARMYPNWPAGGLAFSTDLTQINNSEGKQK
jgi:hypothetical protein